MRYKILQESTKEELEEEVQNYLKKGWKLHGAPSLGVSGSGRFLESFYTNEPSGSSSAYPTIIQAMTKDDECLPVYP